MKYDEDSFQHRVSYPMGRGFARAIVDCGQARSEDGCDGIAIGNARWQDVGWRDGAGGAAEGEGGHRV